MDKKVVIVTVRFDVTVPADEPEHEVKDGLKLPGYLLPDDYDVVMRVAP